MLKYSGKNMNLKVTTLMLLTGHLFTMPSLASSIQVSFLDNDNTRESTLGVLQQAGCPASEVDVLRRAIIHYYNTPFNYDTSTFPIRRDGFYTFTSATDFVAALSTNRLSAVDHMFEYNCLDAALLAAGHKMEITAEFTATGSPYLTVNTKTNGAEWLVPVASLQDAYNTIYPEWYQSFRTSISGQDQPQKYKTIAASLYQYQTLPLGTDEEHMRDELHQILQKHWSRCGVHFPNNVSMIMLHRARTDCHLAVTDHFGVLVKTQDGYMYLEKTGGRGPFLRIDISDIEDIALYYSTMISPDYPLNYMTIDYDTIIEVKKTPTKDSLHTNNARP